MEAVLNELVSVEDLKKFEKKFQSEKAAGSVSKSTQFEYAWCLVRSKYNDDIRKGITLLEELLLKGTQDEQRDYVFYLAVGNYLEYDRALKYVRRAAAHGSPQNNQAKELERLIDKAMKEKVKADGLVGMAIVGGMALGVAGLAGLIGLAVSKVQNPDRRLHCPLCPGVPEPRGPAERALAPPSPASSPPHLSLLPMAFTLRCPGTCP
uniref:Mitochondrial fission 1 protein n=1 Tax=Oryctolagus cuniculus TaxID=9986 RepID=G1TM35_RABIT